MKLILKWVLFITGMIGVAILNYSLLGSWHPMEYYWTIPGILLSGVYSAVEAIVLFPVIWWAFSKKGMLQETVKFLGIDDEEEGS